jgi:hypothetical protein
MERTLTYGMPGPSLEARRRPAFVALTGSEDAHEN